MTVLRPNFQTTNWYRKPRKPHVIPVWIQPSFHRIVDEVERPMMWHVHEALFCFGYVSGLAFREVPREQAKIQIRTLPLERIVSLATRWNGHGSGYVAVTPRKDAVYIGQRLKDAQGGAPLSRVNVMRFVLHGVCHCLIGTRLYYDKCPIYAARNGHLSGPVDFTPDWHAHRNGWAGFDAYEAGRLQERFGLPWLGRR